MDSPFAKFTDTNWTPSESETPTVEALIKERQYVVDRMDEEIQKIEATLNALKESRGVHLKYIQDHKSFLSPVKRLPIDLLSTIFLACRASVPTHGGPYARVPSNMTKDNPAVIISHVCRQWRYVSLNTPLLWADIHVSLPSYPSPNPTGLPPYAIPHNHMVVHRRSVERWESNTARARDVLKIWISRSSGCSLSLRFNAHDIARGLGPWNDTEEDDNMVAIVQEYLAEFVDILRYTSMRWRAVDFAFTINANTTSLLRLLLLPPDQLPLLEVFDFCVLFQIGDDPTLEEQERSLIPSMGGFKSPSLRSLTMSCLWGDIMTISVDWSSLTALNFSGYKLHLPTGPGMPPSASNLPPFFGGKEALSLLKACPRLVHCNLTLQNTYSPHPMLHTDPPPVAVDDQVSLPFLRKLTLQGSAIPNGLASSLILPSLRTLSIMQNSPTPRNEHDSGVVDFVRCFGDQLTTVSFNYFALTSSALVYSLEHLPNVTDLGLMSQLFERGFMRNYPPDDSQPPAFITADVLDRLVPQFSDDDPLGYDDTLEPCFCPKLENFRCSLSRSEFKECDLIKFIAARRGPHTLKGAAGPYAGGRVARIQKVAVKFNSYQEMDIEEELAKRGVDTDGFFVKVVYPPEQSFIPYPIPGSLDDAGDFW